MVALDDLIDRALAEDIHTGDVTTQSVISAPRPMTGVVIAKEDLVLAGVEIPHRVFARLDPSVRCTPLRSDGERLVRGDVIATLEGDSRSLLMGERVSLNFLQRMCGTATLTRRYVDAIAGTKARIVDTRKTTPGLRILEKYAVRVGGGHNHRFGLYDGVLIKENHIAAAGGVTAAIRNARSVIPHTLKIEIETETLEQVEEALSAGADIIMLDNMTIDQMKSAVRLVGGRVLLEASGGVSLEKVREIAETGVDIISVGALTHSAKASDISMLLEGA
ncbi:MAG: carboxylating nicotinate-nucleotide diphosphorylase [Desulfuromonadia bacterium]